jgi:hypothetical protein
MHLLPVPATIPLRLTCRLAEEAAITVDVHQIAAHFVALRQSAAWSHVRTVRSGL